jgi:hypothetical protein
MVFPRVATERNCFCQDQLKCQRTKQFDVIRNHWSASDGTKFMSARSGNCQTEGTRWAGQDREAPERSGGKS